MENFQSRKPVRLWAVCDIVLTGLTVCFSGWILAEFKDLRFIHRLCFALIIVFGVLDILEAAIFLWSTKEDAEPVTALKRATFWRISLSLLVTGFILWWIILIFEKTTFDFD